MIYKKYGNTGKDISVIGFGGMRFVKDGEKYDYDKCAEVIHKAKDLGINYFDTAPGYNEDESEKIFGYAFKNMPKDFYVSTKCSETSGSEVRSSIENSIKRLGVEKINFFHIWCILTLDDYKSRMVKGGAYEAALKAKEEGLIEHIVFSTHCNGDEIEQIINEDKFEGITLGYNILNFPFRQKGIQAAYKKGLGVATMNPLGGGLIPEKPDFFNFIRDENDPSVIAAALRFNASHKEITTVLAGMGTIKQVIENVKAGNEVNEFTESKLDEIKKQLSSKMDTLCTGCQYCTGCPQDIEVSKYMLAYNESILKSGEDCLNMLKWHWGISQENLANCVECGICEGKCTQHLPIIQRIKDIQQF